MSFTECCIDHMRSMPQTKEKYGKQKNVLLRIEWKKWYPLKKFIAFLLWNICLFTVLISTIFYCSEQESVSKTLFGYIIFIITTIATFSPMRKYVSPKYRCLPHIGDVLSKTELNKMLGNEDFQGIEEFKEMSIYPYVKEVEIGSGLVGCCYTRRWVVAIDFGLRTALIICIHELIDVCGWRDWRNHFV